MTDLDPLRILAGVALTIMPLAFGPVATLMTLDVIDMAKDDYYRKTWFRDAVIVGWIWVIALIALGAAVIFWTQPA